MSKNDGRYDGKTRGVRPRDWVIVGLVAAVALALGGYLVLRPSGADGGRADAVPTASTEVTPTSPSSPGPGSTASPGTGSDDASGATTPATITPTETTNPHTDDGSGPGDGVVDEMSQPPVPGQSHEATRIGPFGDMSRRIDGDPMALGDVDAPVVMVSFEDFRCPFCAQFARTTEQKLIKKYVDTGVLRIEWRDLPVFGPESKTAAMAGRAAAEQGKFWEFVLAIYDDAPQHGHPDLGKKDLVDYARQVGVADIEKFKAGFDDDDFAAAVDKDTEEASFLGVPATPAFVIDGYPIVGAQPLDQFTELIEKVQTLS